VKKILSIVILLLFMTPVLANCCCKKIVDYILVRQEIRNNFDEEIRKLIIQGWQPFGGVAVNRFGSFQAMVKYDE
jgi:hypothetical protein